MNIIMENSCSWCNSNKQVQYSKEYGYICLTCLSFNLEWENERLELEKVDNCSCTRHHECGDNNLNCKKGSNYCDEKY